MHGRYVGYYRVSTAKQGVSGLGLAAQQDAVRSYLNGGKWTIAAEFVEVESGRKSDRPALEQALSAARLHRASLIVAKVDRLTRSVAFLSRLLESGVEVRFCDLPQIEGATGRFMLQQMASVAELEAGLISERTRKALGAAKMRGTKLGGFKGVHLAAEAIEASRQLRQDRAQARAAELAPVVAELRSAGVTSLAKLAAALTERGIPTARGGSTWTPMQVSRVLDRLT